MNTIGLDDRNYNWNPKSRQSKKSKYHLLARRILIELFPFDNIYEEVTLPGTYVTGRNLIADFLIPNKNMLVEVHGEQHYSFNKFFHNSSPEYLRAKARDQNKKQWCTLNGITLIELPYNETEHEWRARISNQG